MLTQIQEPDLKAARDKYVQEQTREMLFSMRNPDIPKGVLFSVFMMTFPLLCTTSYLCLLTPMLSLGTVDPASFAYVARSCVRLLTLNITFMGGIHYGLAAANYETAVTDEELKRIKYQMIYSFIPAAMSFSSASFLLFSTPLTLPTVIFGFTGLMMTQLITLQVDLRCIEKEMAPKWFLRFRSVSFAIYMILTSTIFFIYYAKLDCLQRKHDKNRIKNLKNALELEDIDFMQMVNDLKIDYDERDLKEVEKEVNSQLARLEQKQQFQEELKELNKQ